MSKGHIDAPLLLKKVPTVKSFYKKVKQINKTAKTNEIFKFIKKHEYICEESMDNFLTNWHLNMFYTIFPLYLKGYDDEQVKQSLLDTDNYIATKIQGGTKKEKQQRANHRKEVTTELLKELY